jgi:hypothetical protein
MSLRPELKLDWCSEAAAKYAVETWHYSKRLPVFKKVRIGCWEDGKFIGAVLFGQGATPEFGKRFGLSRLQVCELTRVALGSHETPTSRIIRLALKMLKNHCPNLRIVISFADSEQGHYGGIYQAGNWVYAGQSVTHGYFVNRKLEHPKTLHSRYGKGGQSIPWLRGHIDPQAERRIAAVKHRYLMPLDCEMRAQIEPLRQPYPKRVRSVDSDTSVNHAEEGGAIPTGTLL